MAQATKELYQSSNGDRWYLVSDAKSEVFIRHEPNASSGGVASDIEIGAFLSKGPRGPEHDELLRLIGTLVDGSPDSRPRKFTVEFFRIREGD